MEVQQCEELYDTLMKKVQLYHPSKDFPMIEKAYKLARQAHGDQKRKSGEPYIIHPLCVAIILAELELDVESIVAGLLHDVVEDTVYSKDDIAKIFNVEVAELVDGVTKLEKIKYMSKEELQADNYRKMFLAMAKDIRVILIKVADRLHNMRTLQFMRPEKQKEKAQETIDIYAPLADRLGISKIKTELEDLSLRYLDPEAYYDLADKIKRKQSERESYVQNIVENLKEKLNERNIKCDVYGRPKHFFSIYKKMLNQNKTLDQIFDLFAVRVLVDSVRDCYEVLGIVHEIYKPIPSRFKDYISMPKSNMYQSLHNTLIGPEGLPFEIQIRTYEMHRIAEYGIAAHWKYKAGIQSQNQTAEDNAEEEKLSWLRQILEWQKNESDNKVFIESIKMDLDAFSDRVYCFSPTGEVKSLPAGSTPIDFAYSIHSAIGNNMISARVNGKIVTIDYKIQNGDRVEIVTSNSGKGPSMDWLKIVKSLQAKTKINQWFKKVNKEENIVKGKELIEKEAKRKGLVLSEILIPKYMNNVLKRYSFQDWDSICAAVGHGGLKEGQIVNRLNEEYKKDLQQKKMQEEIDLKQEQLKLSLAESKKRDILNDEEKADSSKKGNIYVKGIGYMPDVRFSRCCSPVPGDSIVGFVTRGRGTSIHRRDCVNIVNLSPSERHRVLDAEWSQDTQKASYDADLRIISNPDTDALLFEISKLFVESEVKTKNMNMRNSKNKIIIDVTITISGRNQLEEIGKKLMNIPSVVDIQRITT